MTLVLPFDMSSKYPTLQLPHCSQLMTNLPHEDHHHIHHGSSPTSLREQKLPSIVLPTSHQPQSYMPPRHEQQTQPITVSSQPIRVFSKTPTYSHGLPAASSMMEPMSHTYHATPLHRTAQTHVSYRTSGSSSDSYSSSSHESYQHYQQHNQGADHVLTLMQQHERRRTSVVSFSSEHDAPHKKVRNSSTRKTTVSATANSHKLHPLTKTSSAKIVKYTPNKKKTKINIPASELIRVMTLPQVAAAQTLGVSLSTVSI